MQTLRFLKNTELLSATLRLAGEERRITLEVLKHFREIERRKAYADLGYRSLFEYAVTHLRYSEGSASRRISAMYALKEHPELGPKIAVGETSVTSIARIHSTIRREEKLSEQKWTPEEKKITFQEMATLSRKDLEQALISIAPEAALQERVRPVGNELHEVKLYLSSKDIADLEELRGWMGHSLKNSGSNSETIRKLIEIGRKKFLKEHSQLQKTQKRDRTKKDGPSKEEDPISMQELDALSAHHSEVQSVPRPSEASELKVFIHPNLETQKPQRDASPLVGENQESPETNTDLKTKELRGNSIEVFSESSRYQTPFPIRTPTRAPKRTSVRLKDSNPNRSVRIRSVDRRILFKRAGFRCEFVHPEGKRCDSRSFLQIEHRKPRALGGTNAFSNLEVLCRNHNLIRGIQVFGPERMQRD